MLHFNSEETLQFFLMGIATGVGIGTLIAVVSHYLGGIVAHFVIERRAKSKVSRRREA